MGKSIPEEKTGKQDIIMDRFLVPKVKVRVDTETSRKKYDPDYLKFVFSFIGPDDAPLPLCVVCK